MKEGTVKRSITLAAAALAVVALVGVALARNPHCAGGIQYVSQAMHDKEKGNLEDYRREINKAVDQLQQCATEDPNDFEAIGYLGWAYAEVDSSRLAGEAFAKSIEGLKQKDPKKVEWASQNRESYWATAFNDGIAKINAAQSIYLDFLKEPASDADKTMKEEARKNYNLALTSLTRASLLKPGDPKTMRNLGSVYAFMGQFDAAERTFKAGLQAAPNDSALAVSLKSVRSNAAGQLVDQKKYDEAIALYAELIKSDPSNSGLHLGLADAYFKRAQSKKGDAARPDYKLAGDEYAAAAKFKPTEAYLPFNAALSYQNGGDCKSAEPQWRQALKLRPGDQDAISALGQCLADLGQYDAAIQLLWDGVNASPKNKVFHRQLGSVYTKADNTAKSSEEFMIFLALENGQPSADAKAAAKSAKGARGQTFASAGEPDEVVPWDLKGDKIESWFYWSKKQAYHFKGDVLTLKSDWSAPALKSGGGTSASGAVKK